MASRKKTQARPARASTAPAAAADRRIEHVVVLVLENRSFDHIFGFRKGVEGLTGKESNLLDPTRPQSADNPAISVAQGAPYAFEAPSQGPGHSFPDANEQLTGSKNGPTRATPVANNGFASSYKRELIVDHVKSPSLRQISQVMTSFSADQLPSINALADAFCVCDHWYSEVPGPTQPNRLYMHAATSFGMVHNVWSKKFDGRTIYNNLQDAGFTWAVYWTDDNEVAEFTQVASEADNFKDFDTSFAADAKAGRLPHYTYLIPQFNSRHGSPSRSQHPPTDARYGDHFIADVYEALRANEDAWKKTLLVVTYDEHGGFYDHVVPPSDNVPNPDGINSPLPGDPSWVPAFQFDRLGVRVPALLVSPWIDPGTESRRLQHTSVLATVKKLFGLPSFLTKRDASATPFDDLLTRRETPRDDTPTKLPRAPLPEVSSDPEDPSSPGNARIDQTQQQVNQGLHQLTSSGAGNEPMPSTQHEASLHLQRRVRDYLQQQKARKKAPASFRIVKDARGGHRWQLMGTDGKPAAASARSYPTKAAARKAATSLSELAGHARIVEAEDAAPSRKRAPAAPARKKQAPAAPARKKQKR
jgi:phospholipase C